MMMVSGLVSAMAGGGRGEGGHAGVTTADLIMVCLFATSRHLFLNLEISRVRYRVVAPAAGPRYTAHAGHWTHQQSYFCPSLRATFTLRRNFPDSPGMGWMSPWRNSKAELNAGRTTKSLKSKRCTARGSRTSARTTATLLPLTITRCANETGPWFDGPVFECACPTAKTQNFGHGTPWHSQGPSIGLCLVGRSIYVSTLKESVAILFQKSGYQKHRRGFVRAPYVHLFFIHCKRTA